MCDHQHHSIWAIKTKQKSDITNKSNHSMKIMRLKVSFNETRINFVRVIFQSVYSIEI